jgi:hypothetical protein
MKSLTFRGLPEGVLAKAVDAELLDRRRCRKCFNGTDSRLMYGARPAILRTISFIPDDQSGR